VESEEIMKYDMIIYEQNCFYNVSCVWRNDYWYKDPIFILFRLNSYIVKNVKFDYLKTFNE